MSATRPPSPPPLSTYRPSNERAAFPPRPRPPGQNGGGRARPPQSPRRRNGILSGLLYLFVFVLLTAGAGVAYLVINPPSDMIRQTIAEQVKARTGRDLRVAGAAGFTFYPGVGVSLKDVTLSGPSGSDANMVSMSALDVSVKALPLFSRHIEVESLVLKRPIFDLRIDKSGRRNWDMAASQPRVQYAQAENNATQSDASPAQIEVGQRSKLANVKNLQLSDVRIEDGTFSFTDERSGATQKVEAVNLALAVPSLNEPMTASGTVGWKGETTDFQGTLSNLQTVLDQQPAKLAFTAKNKHLKARYDGTALLKEGADIEGEVQAESISTRDLASWLGTKLPPVAGFGPLSISGRIKTVANTTTFSNANFGLDGATATGTISVTTGAVRPNVQADLIVSELDLNKYLTRAALADTDGDAPSQSPRSNEQPEENQPDAIENLLNDPQTKPPGTKVYGSVHRSGWSSEPLNLTLLGVADGNAKLSIGRLLFQNLVVGKTDMTVELKDRFLKTQLHDVLLYQGSGKGAVNVDGTAQTAAIGAAFALANISAQPFLKDAAKIEVLQGKANVDLQITSTGANQLQLVETLNGTASFALADGAVVGFNLPGAIRGLSKGKFSAFKSAPTEKTDFSEMTASFQITNGIAQNQDLKLVSPLLRVTGAGAVQIPQRTIDYTVKPKLVASLEGQDGNSALSGIEIPVRITGPLDKPKIQPELKAVIENPEQAVETVKDIGKRLKGKNSDEIVDELFGKDDPNEASDKSSTKAKAKEFLNKYFKKSE
ncbi:MAG: AsmA family protein [Hyphomicrobium sp.]|nr:MAG: AsmA family protein [Hyphomicrobium sp.]PPC98314.1 MAG: AsmA family protein [Hyphomicrobium sp.]